LHNPFIYLILVAKSSPSTLY